MPWLNADGTPWDGIPAKDRPPIDPAAASSAPTLEENVQEKRAGLIPAARGMARGITGLAGIPAAIRDIARGGINMGAEAVGLPQIPANKMPGASLPTAEQLEKGLSKVTGPWGHSETGSQEGYTESIAEFIPQAFFGPGGMASKAIQAAAGGAGAEWFAQLTDDMPYARIAGGFLGQLLTGRVIPKAVTPLPADAQRLQYAQTLEKEGVTPTAGQVTGRRPVQYMESHWGDSPAASEAAAHALELPFQQFTQAVLKRAGINAERATPKVVDEAFTKIGQRFDQLENRNNAVYDRQFTNDILDAEHEYNSLVSPLKRAPIVEDTVDGFIQQRASILSGEKYKVLHSRLEKARRSAMSGSSPDVQLGEALASIRDAVDNMMERSIATHNPQDLGAWKDVRRDYRHLLMVERATTGVETGGILRPSKMKQELVRQGRRSYARGKTDLDELVRAGENVMDPLPQSGTAPRQLTTNPKGALMAGIGGTALMNPATQGYLKNQLLAGHHPPGISEMLGRAAIADVAPESRAQGGPVQAGQPYLVGEQGPEIIQPAQSGTVMPAQQNDPYAPIPRRSPEIEEKAKNNEFDARMPKYIDQGDGTELVIFPDGNSVRMKKSPRSDATPSSAQQMAGDVVPLKINPVEERNRRYDLDQVINSLTPSQYETFKQRWPLAPVLKGPGYTSDASPDPVRPGAQYAMENRPDPTQQLVGGRVRGGEGGSGGSDPLGKPTVPFARDRTRAAPTWSTPRAQQAYEEGLQAGQQGKINRADPPWLRDAGEERTAYEQGLAEGTRLRK